MTTGLMGYGEAERLETAVLDYLPGLISHHHLSNANVNQHTHSVARSSLSELARELWRFLC